MNKFSKILAGSLCAILGVVGLSSIACYGALPGFRTSVNSIFDNTAGEKTTINTPNNSDIIKVDNSVLLNVVDRSITSLSKEDLAGITSIGNYAFAGCVNLTSIELPLSVTSIKSYAFSWCESLTSIELSPNLTSIGFGAFNSCKSLTNLTIPLGVTSIADQTFLGCSNLTSIELPSSITSIGSYVFRDCTSSITLKINALTPPTLSNTALSLSSITTILVPQESVDLYKNAWSSYADIIQGY